MPLPQGCTGPAVTPRSPQPSRPSQELLLAGTNGAGPSPDTGVTLAPASFLSSRQGWARGAGRLRPTTNSGWASWRGCSPPGVGEPVPPPHWRGGPCRSCGVPSRGAGTVGAEAQLHTMPGPGQEAETGELAPWGHIGGRWGSASAGAKLHGAKLNHSGWSWGSEPAWPAGLGYTGLTGTWKN